MFGRIKAKLKQHWGFGIFAFLSLFALTRLLRQPVPGHYRIFTGAGRALWSGISPHGTDYGTGVGYWFYSPSCGLFFFGPIGFLPEKLGLIAYMGMSWLVFVAGVFLFVSALLKIPVAKLWETRPMSLFWVGIVPQMFTGILASKLEIIMTGLLLTAAGWIISARRLPFAAFIIAMILNWKFQPLPSIGLLLLVWLTLGYGLVFPLLLFAFLAFWFFAPFAVLPADFIRAVHVQWNEGLSAFVQVAWTDFDNVFSFLRNALGFQLSFAQFQIISTLAGGGLGLSLLVLTVIRRRRIGTHDALRESVSLALASGAAYTVAFSPLSQNNSYILYAPLLLVSLLAFFQVVKLKWRSLQFAMGASWLVMTFAYSDLVPTPLRASIRHWGIKPIACLTMLACLGIYFLKRKNEPKFLLAE